MIAADGPAGSNTRLLSVDAGGTVRHRHRGDLAALFRPGDLVVANEAATLPASLAGTHEPTGARIEVRLAAIWRLCPYRAQPGLPDTDQGPETQNDRSFPNSVTFCGQPGGVSDVVQTPPSLRRRMRRRILPALGRIGVRSKLVVTRYDLGLPGFERNQRPLRIAGLADLHACDPWMPVVRIADIVARVNSLQPDLIVLLGDYVNAISEWDHGWVPMGDWAAALANLDAPLGVFAVLGNHDWREDGDAATAALEDNGIHVLDNDVRRLTFGDGQPFWLAGLADQRVVDLGWGRFDGDDDLPGTLERIDDEAPVILLAHEPDIFPSVPPRVALTLCGHTHGGQCRFPLVGPVVVPSRYWRRYAYGHVVEDDRHMIVSGGLGCSGLPIRFGVPSEIVLVEVSGQSPTEGPG
ncbi:MAG: S-adenosylmethionine:tRNA ribosyltransferase-isomerase [Hyphomicrobiales bacterium]|nr:S-adenosylmethionine:tRNA ribosyltransferase-isomerase [Hyphomicrobiales bacterium]